MGQKTSHDEFEVTHSQLHSAATATDSQLLSSASLVHPQAHRAGSSPSPSAPYAESEALLPCYASTLRKQLTEALPWSISLATCKNHEPRVPSIPPVVPPTIISLIMDYCGPPEWTCTQLIDASDITDWFLRDYVNWIPISETCIAAVCNKPPKHEQHLSEYLGLSPSSSTSPPTPLDQAQHCASATLTTSGSVSSLAELIATPPGGIRTIGVTSPERVPPSIDTALGVRYASDSDRDSPSEYSSGDERGASPFGFSGDESPQLAHRRTLSSTSQKKLRLSTLRVAPPQTYAIHILTIPKPSKPSRRSRPAALKLKGLLQGHHSPIFSLHFIEARRRLVSASRDGVITLWDAVDLTSIRQFWVENLIHMAPLPAGWGPYGVSPSHATYADTFLAVATSDKLAVQIWNADKGRLEVSIDVCSRYRCASTISEVFPLADGHVMVAHSHDRTQTSAHNSYHDRSNDPPARSQHHSHHHHHHDASEPEEPPVVYLFTEIRPDFMRDEDGLPVPRDPLTGGALTDFILREWQIADAHATQSLRILPDFRSNSLHTSPSPVCSPAGLRPPPSGLVTFVTASGHVVVYDLRSGHLLRNFTPSLSRTSSSTLTALPLPPHYDHVCVALTPALPYSSDQVADDDAEEREEVARDRSVEFWELGGKSSVCKQFLPRKKINMSNQKQKSMPPRVLCVLPSGRLLMASNDASGSSRSTLKVYTQCI